MPKTRIFAPLESMSYEGGKSNTAHWLIRVCWAMDSPDILSGGLPCAAALRRDRSGGSGAIAIK